MDRSKKVVARAVTADAISLDRTNGGTLSVVIKVGSEHIAYQMPQEWLSRFVGQALIQAGEDAGRGPCGPTSTVFAQGAPIAVDRLSISPDPRDQSVRRMFLKIGGLTLAFQVPGQVFATAIKGLLRKEMARPPVLRQ